MNEVVIFCESYTQIKNALYLVRQNRDNHPVTVVITGMRDLHKLFDLVNEKIFQKTLNVVYFDIYRGRLATRGSRLVKAMYLLPDIIRERRYLKAISDKYFARLKGAEVFFFSRYFNPSTFYLLKALARTNCLTYMPDPTYDAVPMPQSAPDSLIELVHLAWGKSVYGRDIIMTRHPLGQRVLGMPDKFLSESVSRVISREERDSLLKDFNLGDFNLLDSGNYRVMYFHEDLVEHEYIADATLFEERLAEVFRIIGKYFSEDKVALKYHPGGTESETAVLFGSRLPDFIPAEFLYDDKIKMYVGITSMALANVERGVAVSLIDLIGFKSDTIRERLKKYLIQWSRSDILFPQSLDEFERIVMDIKRQELEQVE